MTYEEEVAAKYGFVERGITNRFSGAKLTEATTLEGIGAHTLHTPAADKYLTLYWIALSSSEHSLAETLATVEIGSTVIYDWYLSVPGAFMHWEPIKGALAAALKITFDHTATVAVSYTYSESTN